MTLLTVSHTEHKIGFAFEVRRFQTFEQDGVDVLYRPRLPGLDAIREVCASVSKPVNVVMGLKVATFTVDDLASTGVKRISVGGAFARAALGGFMRGAQEVKEQGTFIFASNALFHSGASSYMEGGAEELD